MTPDRISHYRILERIGVGGMGTVYRAQDERSGAIVAVKVLHQHLAADPTYVRRLEREARIARSIDSPNVVRVLEAGRDGDSYYLAMEYVPGQTLAQIIEKRGQLPVEEAVRIAASIAAGLAAAHAKGIVHRDISPQNVIIMPSGEVKLADFGVARDLGQTAMTATNMLLGKPQYIAPEIVTGRGSPDIRSDIYALGVVMYQMLAGTVPFHADTPYAVMQMQVHDVPRPIGEMRGDVPGWLQALLERCLAKDPGQRYPSPQTLAAELHASGQAGGVATAMSAPRKKAPRTWLLVGGGSAGAAVVGLVLALAAMASAGSRPEQASEAVLLEQTTTPVAPPTGSALTNCGSRPSIPPDFELVARSDVIRTPDGNHYVFSSPVSLVDHGKGARLDNPKVLLGGDSVGTNGFVSYEIHADGKTLRIDVDLGKPGGLCELSVQTFDGRLGVVVFWLGDDGSEGAGLNSSTPTLQEASGLPAEPQNRASCDEIRGTEYRSEDERAWYVVNCAPTSVPTSSPTSIPISPTARLVSASWFESNPDPPPNCTDTALDPDTLPTDRFICLSWALGISGDGSHSFRISWTSSGGSGLTPERTATGAVTVRGQSGFRFPPGLVGMHFLVDGLSAGYVEFQFVP
jgi:serine/threonine protein kinase